MEVSEDRLKNGKALKKWIMTNLWRKRCLAWGRAVWGLCGSYFDIFKGQHVEEEWDLCFMSLEVFCYEVSSRGKMTASQGYSSPRGGEQTTDLQLRKTWKVYLSTPISSCHLPPSKNSSEIGIISYNETHLLFFKNIIIVYMYDGSSVSSQKALPLWKSDMHRSVIPGPFYSFTYAFFQQTFLQYSPL